MRIKTIPKFISVLVLTGLLAAAIGACGDEEKQASEAVSTTPTSTGLTPLTKEYIVELAGRRIGEPRLVRDVQLSDDAVARVVDIHIDRPSVCHDGAVVGTGTTFSQKVMALLFRYPEVARVNITIYGVEQGVQSSEIAMKVGVDRAAADKIDWFQFNDRTVAQLATEYYVHPKIAENYAAEGGDPAGPKPQTQTAPAV